MTFSHMILISVVHVLLLPAFSQDLPRLFSTTTRQSYFHAQVLAKATVHCNKSMGCPKGMKCTYYTGAEGVCKSSIPGSTSCTTDKECPRGTKCVTSLVLEAYVEYKLKKFKPVCLPVPDYTKDKESGLFGPCGSHRKCNEGQCVNGICQSANIGNKCTATQIWWLNKCGNFASCIYGRCSYGFENSHCQTSWYRSRCLPGLRCITKPNMPIESRGRCRRAKEGSPCMVASECPYGFICGTRGKCVRSAEKQFCLSNFWCPIGSVCKMSTQSCTYDVSSLTKEDKEAVAKDGSTRAKLCVSDLDCPQNDDGHGVTIRCLNGVCLPADLFKKCKDDYGCTREAHCRNGRCVEAARGMSCERGCYYGLVCISWSSKKCVPHGFGWMCNSPDGCPQGLLCRNSKCVLSNEGSYCKFNAQCQKPLYCINRMCKRYSENKPVIDMAAFRSPKNLVFN